MEKENKKLMVLVVILLITVVGLGGYITYDKLSSKDINQEKPNGKNNIVEKPEEKDYDLTEANKLMDIYSGILRYREIDVEYGRQDYEESYKVSLAYDYTANSKINSLNKQRCDKLTNNNDNFCQEGRPLYTVKYEDINNTYKYLFGNDSEIVKKGYGLKQFRGLTYIEKEDLYIESGVWGVGTIIYYWGYKVNTAKVLGNELKINVSYSKLNGVGVEVVSPYTGTIYGCNEIQKFVDAEYQQFDKYEFVFEYENGHYIFKDVVKA